MSSDSSSVRVQNNFPVRATSITLRHINDATGQEQQTWNNIAPGACTGNLTAHFDTGVGHWTDEDYWQVEVILVDGSIWKNGKYDSSGGKGKECQLQSADDGKLITFTVNGSKLQLNLPSGGCSDSMGQVGQEPSSVNYNTWMESTTAIHDKLLRNICLPMTHDSGAYQLSNDMVDGGSIGNALYNTLQDIADAIGDIPGIGKYLNGLDPMAWVTDAAGPAIKGLATPTTKSVAQQLSGGMRGLDLRVYYDSDSNDFWTFHGFKAASINTILTDVKSFLSSTSGEVVYITMGHYLNFDDDGTAYNSFLDQVKSELGDYAYVQQTNNGSITNSPFDTTYQDIISQGGTAKSRVILVDGCPTDVPYHGKYDNSDGTFWPIEFSPPDYEGLASQTSPPTAGMHLYGSYTKTDSASTMLPDQKGKFSSALSNNLPFAGYMTLTPTGTDYTVVVVTSLAGAVTKLAAVTPIPIDAALLVIAAGLEVGSVALSWSTLEELSAKVGDNLSSDVWNYLAYQSPTENKISLLYVDYFENTNVVAIAIALSTEGLT